MQGGVTKIALAIMTSVFMFSGCSVKEGDNDLVKAAKYTANAPIYAVAAVGLAGTMIGGGIGYSVSKTGDAIAGRERYQGETFIGTFETEQLDNNVTLAAFYEDGHYKTFKNSENENFLYIKSTKELILTDNLLKPKRWATAGLEGRPIPPYVGYRLPSSVTKEMIEEKAGKDQFGNPAFLGKDALVLLRPKRTGWLMELHYEVFALTGSAQDFTNADTEEPETTKEWLLVNFPEAMKDEDAITMVRP
jgi:F0F1-type ATP synthase membrane subunit c/vacuolar-type H+-ATPase subunit K